MAERFDCVIIGSGFGGSVMACRLAEAGKSVLVLERGRRWKIEDYPSVSQENWIWDQDEPENENGWIDLRVFKKMAVAQGAGVGGGSLIYANISIEAEPETIDNGWPKEINFKTLKPFYDKAGKMLAVSELPDGQLTERFKLVKDSAEATGNGDRFRKLDLAVTFDPDWNYDLDDPHNIAHSKTTMNEQGVKQGSCIHCGNCDIGCPVHAKNTLDLNYLAAAESNGAEIRPLHFVNRIEPKADGYNITYDILQDGEKIPGAVEATEVYVAAGSLGSSELLLRNRDEYKTLPNISKKLGYGWSSNGDFLTPTIYSDRVISPTRGPTITAAVSFLDGVKNGNRFFVQDGGFPDLIGNALEEIARKKGIFYKVLKLFSDSIFSEVRDRDPMQHVMPWFGQGVDADDGQFVLSRKWFWPWQKELNLKWDPTKSEPVVQALIDMHKEFSEATGGVPIVPPSWTLLHYLITPHPLGGCRMADTADEGVVNHKGEVFGYKGLYVVDGAVFPRSVGLNPSRTIAAIAEYIADQRLSSAS